MFGFSNHPKLLPSILVVTLFFTVFIANSESLLTDTIKYCISSRMNTKTSKLKALHDAIEAAGGQTALANRLNETKYARKIGRTLKQQNINIWIGLGHIPTGWVLPVEEV